MPGPKRRSPVAVIDRLFAEPYRFEFYQALRLLEQWHAGTTPRGDVLARHVSFRNSLALTFPPSEIESLKVLPTHEHDRIAGSHAPAPDSSEELPSPRLQPAESHIEIVPSFFGLLGVNGTLPLFYTELFAQRELYHKDHAARRFLDVFQQRAVTLLYEAWRKHRLPLHHEEDRQRHFLPSLLALAGLPRGAPRDADGGASAVRDEDIAYFAGVFQQGTRPAGQMQRVLASHFGVPVRVEQFVGRWNELPAEALTQLGGQGAVLGASTVLGPRVWQRDLRLRLCIGPLNREQFDRFLPQGPCARALSHLLTLMGGLTFEYEVMLLLRPEDVPAPTLAARGDDGPRLGWDGWLLGQAPAHPLNDARYDITAAA